MSSDMITISFPQVKVEMPIKDLTKTSLSASPGQQDPAENDQKPAFIQSD